VHVTNRLFFWLILVAATGASAPAAAVGLGTPHVHSVLGEPIDAVLPIRGGKTGAVYRVRVADEAEFGRLGLKVPSWVRQVTLSVEQGVDGASYVRLASRAPMREPLVYLVVELTWEGGRLLREVALLFDPPTLRRSAPLPAPRQEAAPIPAAQHRAAAGAATAATTRPNDTLWALAQRLRPTEVSQSEMMAALFDANPGAFVNGDPDRLRLGVTLQVPLLPGTTREGGAGEATSRPASDKAAAESTVPARQNNVEAPASTSLRVVSPEESEGGAPLDELHTQLHIVRAEIDTRRAQNQAMLSRVAELEQRSAVLLRELQAKEQASAELRAKLGDGAEATGAAPSEAATFETDTPAPAPAPRVDAWRGWALAISALAVGAVASAVLLLLTKRRGRGRPAAESLGEVEFRAQGRALRSGSNYAPSVFAETSAALDGVLTDDETKADPMMEVAFLKNFGRWDQAEALLRDLISQYPKRDDFRFELLELYYRAENTEAFKAFAGALQQSLSRRAPGLWAEITRMGQRLDPSDPLFRGDAATAEQRDQGVDEAPPRSASG